MTFHFERDAGGPIIVSIEIDGKYELNMISDTGASHTTIDSKAMHLLGYDLVNSIGKAEIETANGIIETVPIAIGIELKSFFSLGLTKNKFQIQVYDFLAHGVISDYNGLLGLDFLEGTKFCIDTKLNVITLN